MSFSGSSATSTAKLATTPQEQPASFATVSEQGHLDVEDTMDLCSDAGGEEVGSTRSKLVEAVTEEERRPTTANDEHVLTAPSFVSGADSDDRAAGHSQKRGGTELTSGKTRGAATAMSFGATGGRQPQPVQSANVGATPQGRPTIGTMEEELASPLQSTVGRVSFQDPAETDHDDSFHDDAHRRRDGGLGYTVPPLALATTDEAAAAAAASRRDSALSPVSDSSFVELGLMEGSGAAGRRETASSRSPAATSARQSTTREMQSARRKQRELECELIDLRYQTQLLLEYQDSADARIEELTSVLDERDGEIFYLSVNLIDSEEKDERRVMVDAYDEEWEDLLALAAAQKEYLEAEEATLRRMAVNADLEENLNNRFEDGDVLFDSVGDQTFSATRNTIHNGKPSANAYDTDPFQLTINLQEGESQEVTTASAPAVGVITTQRVKSVEAGVQTSSLSSEELQRMGTAGVTSPQPSSEGDKDKDIAALHATMAEMMRKMTTMEEIATRAPPPTLEQRLRVRALLWKWWFIFSLVVVFFAIRGKFAALGTLLKESRHKAKLLIQLAQEIFKYLRYLLLRQMKRLVLRGLQVPRDALLRLLGSPNSGV